MAKQEITRSADLRAGNRLRILKTLRKLGPSTHDAIVEATQLSPAAVSTQTTALVAQGIVSASREKTPNQSSRGRPRSIAALNASAGDVITLTISINLFEFFRLDYTGRTLAHHTEQCDTKLLSLSAFLSLVQRGINYLCPNGSAAIRRIGIGVQGVVEQHTGKILWSPILCLERVDIKHYIESQIGLPVTIDNDCTLIASALHGDQQNRYGDTFATILFSYGVGLGMYHNGTALLGRHSSALELGHMIFSNGGAICRCGKRGCIEAYAADYAIDRRSREGTLDDAPVDRVSTDPLADAVLAAQRYDSNALAAFEEAGKAVGFGIGQLFTLFDPIPVVLVGRNTETFSLMRRSMMQTLTDCHRDGAASAHLIHHKNEAKKLLHQGLAQETLAVVDSYFALSEDSSKSTDKTSHAPVTSDE